MALRLIFLGPPGVGKGTQAALASDHFGIPQIATGDILREAVRQGSEMGRAAQQFMNRGELVPDDVVVGIVGERITRPDCEPGFLLDGFPRTVPQAEALDRMLQYHRMPLDAVVLIAVPEDELVSRLSSRWVCARCGRTYPDAQLAAEGACASDGEKLHQRSDDRPEVVRNRLDVYRKQTAPLVDYYLSRGLIRELDGVGDVHDVHRRIRVILGEPSGAR